MQIKFRFSIITLVQRFTDSVLLHEGPDTVFLI
jgi:hypothetical protein